MGEFQSLMGAGFTETRGQIGVPVIVGSNGPVTGILTPGPFQFLTTQAGEEIMVDQSVDVLASDLTTLGLSTATLPASCANRITINVDGTDCSLIAFGNESSDPIVKLYLKIAR